LVIVGAHLLTYVYIIVAGLTMLALKGDPQAVHSSPLYNFSITLFMATTYFFLLHHAAKSKKINIFHALAVSPIKLKKVVFLIFIGLLYSTCVWYLVNSFGIRLHTYEFKSMFRNPAYSIPFFIYAVTLGPFIEEMLLRGALYSAIREKYGDFAALIGTAVVDTVLHSPTMHFGLSSVIVKFISSALYTLVRARYNSVSASFVVHAASNGASGVLFGLHRLSKLLVNG